MEENNNNESQIKNTIKNEGKKLAKDGLKAVLKPLKKYIIIGVGIFIGILLTLGLLNIVDYTIKNIFSNLISIFTTSSAGDAEATTSETNDSVIYIDNNGYYKLKESYSEKILEELIEQKVNTKLMGFNLENEEDKQRFRDMIDKYIKTEVETTFPKTGNNWGPFGHYNDVDGNITVKRAFAETGEVRNLEYKKYSQFCSYIESNNDKALECFSVNPDNFKLCMAKRTNKTVYYDTEDGTDGKVTGGGEIELEELEYRTLLENYSVPLNYLITMHMFSQDVDFMDELVELASGADKKEPLVITYVETQKEHTSIFNYEGVIEEKIKSFTEINESNEEGVGNLKNKLKEKEIEGKDIGSTISMQEINNGNASEYYDDAVNAKKQVTINYYGKLYVTKTDTWLKRTERTVTAMPTPEIDEGTIITDIADEGNLKDDERTGKTYAILDDDDESVYTRIMDTIYKATEMTETLTGKSKTYDFSVISTVNEITIQEFIDLIEKYPEVKEKIQNSPSNIFYLLQENENTQKLEKIMRYVLYELNDVDYGVKLEDLDFLLEDIEFLSVSDGIYDGQTVQQTLWYTLLSKGYSKESAAGVMGNIYVESGFRTNELENIFEIGGTHSLGHTDESYTEAVNNGTYSRESFISDHIYENCGAGYGLLQWTWYTRKAALYDLAKNSGKDIDDANIQIQYLLTELSGIKSNSVWRTTNSPQEAARALCQEFVNPGAGESNLQERAKAAQRYYDEFKEKDSGVYQPGVGSGNYSNGTYISSKGRTFRILNQNKISGWGSKCNRAAAAIIASGYSEQDDATLINVMNDKYAERGDTIVAENNYWNLYGLELKGKKDMGYKTKDQYVPILREQLKSGGYAMIWLGFGRETFGESGTKWTKNIHWVAILDYSENTDQIIIADWRGAKWYNITEFQSGISGIALIDEM